MCINVSCAGTVFLKADDFSSKGKWVPFTSELISRKIPFNIGLVSDYLESNEDKKLLLHLSKSPLVAFFFHGKSHDCSGKSFLVSTTDKQKKIIKDALDVINRIVDLSVTGFSGPCNQANGNTQVALNELGIGYWLLPYVDHSKFLGVVYKNRVNVERKTGVVDYDFFKSEFLALLDKDDYSIVIQVHPNMWTEKSLREFFLVVDFFIENGWGFGLLGD